MIQIVQETAACVTPLGATRTLVICNVPNIFMYCDHVLNGAIEVTQFTHLKSWHVPVY